MSKVWFITGCSTGFGRVLAEELLKGGATVIATARNVASLDSLPGNEASLLRLPLDVTKPESINVAVTAAMDRFGRIDVLVNNAGYGTVGAVEETDMASIRRVFETNVFGLIQVTQAILPAMRRQKAGHILNISSVAGLVSMPGFGVYNATKYAVEGLTEALAAEVAPFNIHVTAIEPGPFRTDFANRSLDAAPETEAYKASVGKMRQYIASIDGTQPGDPVKAARIMMEIVTMEKPPLRLPLGNSAVDRIRAKLVQSQKDLDSLEKLARSADYEASSQSAA